MGAKMPAAARTSTLSFDAKQLLDAVVGAAAGDGRVPDRTADFAKERGDKKLVVIAAAPKAGSTFLVNTLIQLTGLRGFRLCSAYSTNENDLYLPALCLMNRHGCVSQLHMKGTFHNAALMKSFGITPVILVRRIEDIVVSLLHDLRQKANRRAFGTGLHGYSFVWQDRCTKELSEQRLADLVIDLALPWFVNFYVSWYRLCEQGAVTALWVTYEELVERKRETLRKVLDFLGVEALREMDEKLLSRRYATFRDGRVGHGASILTEAQRRRIRELFSYYPTVDFGKYGLPSG
ncbi:MAG TPA: sulfotransferase domain-containing protein [Casimicrobiaceae bacterium]|nr:sulfotransferase domain-containing protein [Casimicrobiaceae bacterium]